MSEGQTVYWNDDHSPFAVARDTAVAGNLARVSRHEGSYIHGPAAVLKSDGTPYRVFTAYWNKWHEMPVDLPGEPAQTAIVNERGVPLPLFEMQPDVGEHGAHRRMDAFLSEVDDYETIRDDPSADATSRLSADLKFGTIAPHRLAVEVGDATQGRRAFLRQLAWRDFYAQIMADRPDTTDTEYRHEYSSIAWAKDREGFEAWKTGRTGFPLVDAGMRQLASEGFMHNRVRMIAASFLVKDLLIDWRLGERWFRRHLLDGDVAQNVGNWQWVAGTGVDAAPYFRVFNPTTQSRRFDPHGEYIRRWVPELNGLSGHEIHDPWETAPTNPGLSALLIRSGYPMPIVDHREARSRTIEVYESARRRT
jgi:deoxyribodipyrimidine photo-lyase